MMKQNALSCLILILSSSFAFDLIALVAHTV